MTVYQILTYLSIFSKIKVNISIFIVVSKYLKIFVPSRDFFAKIRICGGAKVFEMVRCVHAITVTIAVIAKRTRHLRSGPTQDSRHTGKLTRKD